MASTLVSTKVAIAGIKALKKDWGVTLGIGDGSGQLFVHGSYEAVKVCQEKLFHMEQLEMENKLLKERLLLNGLCLPKGIKL